MAERAEPEQKKTADKPEKPKGKAPAGLKMKQAMRLVETNLEGRKPVGDAIRSVMGVGHQFSNAVVQVGGFKGALGDLSEPDLRKLEDIIAHPDKYGIPAWLYNRRRDPQLGTDRHLSVSALDFVEKQDINELKKIRAYKGVRHGLGLPVRGQRTRSSGRGKTTVGVQRKRVAASAGGAARGKETKK